jgi:LPS-assembly lipoprotein
MLFTTKKTHFLIAVILIGLLQACGFKLRGEVELSSDMSPIYLQQNSVFELGREIKSLLISNKIDLVESEKSSKSQLLLINEAKERRVLSVDTDGRAREYLLSYNVTFSIKINSVESVTDEPAAEDHISISRSLLFDSDAVLAVANESEILYKDMRRDAARLILLKLQAKSSK